MPAACSSKTRMNSSPDDQPFSLRVGDAPERSEKALGGVDVYQVEVKALEHAYYRLRLAAPHQPVVDEHAGELVADGAMH